MKNMEETQAEVKIFGKYGRKLWNDMENMEEKLAEYNSTYFSSIFSISFHNSTYFSFAFSISFHYSTYWKYGRKVSWIVKRYGKCRRKVGWILKYGKYGRKVK
jgi:hypothetical protein